MATIHEIYNCTDLRVLRRGLVEAMRANDSERMQAYAHRAAAVSRANRDGRPIGLSVDYDVDAEWRRARTTIARSEQRAERARW